MVKIFYVALQGGRGWTDRPAENLGGFDRDKESTVEPAIAGFSRTLEWAWCCCAVDHDRAYSVWFQSTV